MVSCNCAYPSVAHFPGPMCFVDSELSNAATSS